MVIIKTIIDLIKNPRKLVAKLGNKGFLCWLPDEQYLKLLYRAEMGKKLDLKNPKSFNEKLQWLKLYDKNPKYVRLVDKYEVRKYISEILGEEYLIPLIDVYNSVDEIDWDKLPEQFVLKCTHGSGFNIICKNKSALNIDVAKKKLKKWMKKNWYWFGREWPYRNVKPRIICEPLIKTNDDTLPNDYKFHCFHGEPDNVMVCMERESGEPKFYFFDSKWNLLRYNISGINAPHDFTLPKPERIDEMFSIAKRLSEGFPFVRVDLYYENDKIYFGELTFYPQSGFDPNLLPETDLLFGDKIKLDKIKK
ncbi:MAG: glycosyl transferase [Clostridiales bacterium]|jgi:hypothetical protein|nr:glycosyl transferase [Clostridiales bacterium]